MIPILLLAQAATTPAPTAPAAPWSVVERPGPNGAPGAVSSAVNVPDGRLVVRCDRVGAGVVSIQFIPHEPLRGFGQQPVSLQFDSGTPLIDNWELMGAGAVEREERAAATLSAGIAHARAIRLKTTDRMNRPVDIAFPGPAAEAPIARVAAACGRTLGMPLAPAPAPAAPSPAPR